MDYIIHEGHRFTITEEFPEGFFVWNIGEHAPTGFLPLCKLKSVQPFDGAREVDTDHLLALFIPSAMRSDLLNRSMRGDVTRADYERLKKDQIQRAQWYNWQTKQFYTTEEARQYIRDTDGDFYEGTIGSDWEEWIMEEAILDTFTPVQAF